LTDAVGDAVEDVGDFFSDQWDNGNIQKGLLAAGTLASGGMLGFGLASGSLMGTQILAGGLGFASGLSGSYEVFSGNRIGDGSFTRYLGATAAVTGGFFAAGVRSFGTVGRTLSGASGLISGYEIASGDAIGDGTLSSLFHVSNLGVNQGGTMFSPTSSNAQRFGVGLNLTVGTASVITSGDRSLQQSLRALSIASGVWNTGTSLIAATQSMTATLRTVSAAKEPRRVRYVAADPEESDDGGLAQVPPEYALKDKSDDAITARIRDRFRRGDPIVHEFIMENDVRFGYRKSEDGVFDDRTIDEISFGYVKYIVESNLKDGDGKTFQRALFHRDVSEYQILATTQRAIRSTPSFKARETEYYRVNPIPESTDDWIRPGSPEYDQLIARRQEAYYTWMGDMGATESEVTWARTRANIIDTIKPGGYLEQIVHMAAATRTAQIGSSKLKGGVAQEYKIAPPAPPRAPTPVRPVASATKSDYSTSYDKRAEPPAVPSFNWRSPQAMPSPDAQLKHTMPRLNNNGHGQPYGTPAPDVVYLPQNWARTIHPGAQGKHIVGHNNFVAGRSFLAPEVSPQTLLDGAYAGTYPVVGYGARGNPIVDFGSSIGVDGSSGLPTRYGQIHSSKHGAHIVPHNPNLTK
jgi:hypothetical protein